MLLPITHKIGNPLDPVEIEANFFARPSRSEGHDAECGTLPAMANPAALRPFVKLDVIPGGLKGSAGPNIKYDLDRCPVVIDH